MVLLSKNNVQAACALLALGAIFAPNVSITQTARYLAASDEKEAVVEEEHIGRRLGITCPPGQKLYEVDWSSVNIDTDAVEQYVDVYDVGDVVDANRRLSHRRLAKKRLKVKKSKSGSCSRNDVAQAPDGTITFDVETTPDPVDVISPTGGSDPEFPSAFATLEIEFEVNQNITDISVAVGGLDSDLKRCKASRIQVFNEDDEEDEVELEVEGGLKKQGKFAYEEFPGRSGSNKKFKCNRKKPNNGKRCKKIKFDQAAFVYDEAEVGTPVRALAAPGVDMAYCAADPDYVAPTGGEPTNAAPTSTSGVNGDPLIMGLQGQLFKFDGRNGGWYSAISSPSFQWNMRVHKFDTCPLKSDTFTTGVGFSFFDKQRKAYRQIEISVVNERNVDVGCAAQETCLGAGSLEMIIDGVKHTAPGNFNRDEKTQILAFNTFHQCSRKWFDFDIVQPEATQSTRSGRRLAKPAAPGVFETIGNIKDTMIDKEECEKWLNDRRSFQDLFKQHGHYTTILIKTEDISFHVEYKQENERCNAHSLDVWMSSVSPALYEQKWEGIIGETKDETQGDKYSRLEVLKHANDEDYEVEQPFSTKCKGCHV